MSRSICLAGSKISENVKRFIAAYIDSVELLEVLLLLRSHANEWSAESVSQEIRSSPTSVTKRLTDLCDRGLLSMKDSRPPLYFYKTRTDELDGAVRELAEAYRERPTRVIELIFSKQTDTLRDFSDAFKFRKDD